MQASADILIVDDDPIMRELASTKLSEFGYFVDTAENGAVGLEKLNTRKFDLVVCDLDMPVLNGYKLTEEIRMSPQLTAIPVIVITGSGHSAAVERAFSVGATSFLAKPINWPLLGHSVQFVLKASRDQFSLRLARDQARAGERFKDSLMSLMSHELRTPLNAIIGFGQILKEQFDQDEDATGGEYADYVVDGGRRLLNSISDMLLASDARSGPICIDDVDCTLEDLITPAVDVSTKSANLAQASIKVAIHDKALEIRCDRQLVSRAIGKLIDNAVKFSQPGVTVLVGSGLTRTGDLVILVKDDGPGIDPERLRIVTTPFESTDMSLRRSQEGLGLGLPLVQAIASAHDATFRLQSTPGDGASAYFILPKNRLSTYTSQGADDMPESASSSSAA